jgi:hypothetical protein
MEERAGVYSVLAKHHSVKTKGDIVVTIYLCIYVITFSEFAQLLAPEDESFH